MIPAPDHVREYALGWGTLAFINAGLAQTKNRSGLAWFLATLFLGPIATVLIVLLDKEAPPAPGRPPFDLQDFRKQ